MTRNIIISFSTLITLLTAGCSTNTPTVGDRMITQSTHTQELGDQWNRGKALVTNGEKLVQEGEEQRAKGTRMISEGQQTIKESETIFKQRFPTQSINKL